MDILLETERMVLRRFTKNDAHYLYELDNDPEVMRYINGGVPTSLETIQKQIMPTFLYEDKQRPWSGFWAAVAQEQGEFLGWFCLRAAEDDPQTAVLGYRFRKETWGQGYATEGAQALVDHGFGRWGVQRIVATTYQDNLASQRVMEKVGMTLIRRFRITAEDLEHMDTYNADSLELWDGDDVEYALTKTDWEQQNKGA